jgi:hypothetical protein
VCCARFAIDTRSRLRSCWRCPRRLDAVRPDRLLHRAEPGRCLDAQPTEATSRQHQSVPHGPLASSSVPRRSANQQRFREHARTGGNGED